MKIEKFYTYVLVNRDGTRTYTGTTKDLERRLLEHNQGKEFSTKPYRPYVVLTFFEYDSLSEARHKEKFLKSTTGRRQLKIIVGNWKSNKI